MQDYCWLATRLDKSTLKSYSQTFQIPFESSLAHLAYSLATNDFWVQSEDSVIVHRQSEQDGILAVWCRTTADKAREIRTQLNYLPLSLKQIINIEFEQCLELAQSLAAIIRGIVPVDELNNASVLSIPRGGLFVKALLSYLLPLRQHQVQAEVVGNSPIILIDDCAISGYRLHQQLQKMDQSQVYFFTLYSPQVLRQFAMQAEPNLLAFESVVDLPAHIKNATQQTSDEGRYWQGQCDAIVFPWSETQRYYRSDGGGEHFPLWSVAPHHCVMKPESPDSQIKQFAVYDSNRGVIAAKANVLYFSDQGVTQLFNFETGYHYSLRDSGSAIWNSLLTHSSIHECVSQLSKEFAVDEQTISQDIENLIERMRNAQLII